MHLMVVHYNHGICRAQTNERGFFIRKARANDNLACYLKSLEKKLDEMHSSKNNTTTGVVMLSLCSSFIYILDQITLQESSCSYTFISAGQCPCFLST